MVWVSAAAEVVDVGASDLEDVSLDDIFVKPGMCAL
jgi:hypothetical protein